MIIEDLKNIIEKNLEKKKQMKQKEFFMVVETFMIIFHI